MARSLGIMSDIKAGVPRTGYNGVVTVRIDKVSHVVRVLSYIEISMPVYLSEWVPHCNHMIMPHYLQMRVFLTPRIFLNRF